MKKLFLIFLLCIGAFNLTGGAAYQNQDFESGIVYEMPNPYEALLAAKEDPEDEEEEKRKTGSPFATIKKLTRFRSIILAHMKLPSGKKNLS